MINNTVQEILPPEAVPIHFIRASLGTRFGAQVLDIFITFGSLFLLIIFLAWIGVFSYNAIVTLVFLGSFFVRIPYYILSELIWNGQTLGKRITRIHVISASGRSLEPYQIVARNLMKEVEVFYPIGLIFGLAGGFSWLNVVSFFWLIISFSIPIINKKNMRLGDMIAGTMVIEKPKFDLKRDLSVDQNRTHYQFEFDINQLDIYGRYELETLEKILRKGEGRRPPDYQKNLEKVAKTIQKKIKFNHPIPRGQERQFLMDFYAQERKYLEGKNLFGDHRADKFHKYQKDEAQK